MTELTPNERIVYDALVKAANASAPAPKHDELNELIGCSSTSTSPTIVRRLEEKGLVEVERFQRTRQICIVETGKCTAMPLSTAPHWRNRPRDVPAPSLAIIRERKPDVAAQIFTQATKLGKPVVEYLADLVFVGFEVEKSRG